MGRGGRRYGAGRPTHKGKAEACMRLDVRVWHRRGMLVPGYSGAWSWSNSYTGERTGSIGYRIEPGAAVLTYALGGEPRQQRVLIRCTPCNYGGTRPWFACPACGGRVALLYLRRGGFHCRKCAQVAYCSQSEDACDRSWRKQQKAEAKLGDDWARPKGMHRATYERLLMGIQDCEQQKDAMLFACLVRHLPGLMR